MQKILITGGAGYIGSHTVHFLISKGIIQSDIIVFDNLVYGHKDYLPKGVIFINGDLLNKNEIKKCFDTYDIMSVIHFAAYTYVGESMKNPGKYFENNVLGGLNLLEEMRKHNVKNIVFSSSCAVYGIPKNIPITESEEFNPISSYGETKLMFEKFLGWYDHIYGIKSVSLRYFNAAGAGYQIGENHNPESHLIPLVINTAIGKNKSISIYGEDYPTEDGTCLRDYIHVIDLADAHYKSLNYLNNGGKTNQFNLGTGRGTSVKEIIDLVKNISGKDFKVIIEKRRDGDPEKLVASNERAKEILGWEPNFEIEDIIKDAYLWHRGLM